MTPLLLLVACVKTSEPVAETPVADAPAVEAPAEAPATETPATDEHPHGEVTTKDHMIVHMAVATSARDALIAGDVESARKSLAWFGDHLPPTDLPDGWGPHISEMREHAKAGVEAEDIRGVSLALSQMAVACGSCHDAMDKGPTFEPGEPPSDVDTVTTHMQRHQWSADRLWEGLIGPSELSWNLGADSLDEAPVQVADLYPGQQLPDAAAKVGQWIHDLGSFGGDIAAQDRDDFYGEFIASCAECHTLMGRGPNNTTPVEERGE